MFLETLKEVLVLVFYLAITYALSLRIIGGLTLKAGWEYKSYTSVSYKTKLLLALAFLNLLGIPPLPLFWAKAALMASILPKISTTQLVLVVVFTNLIILLYSTMWSRALLHSSPKHISSKKINEFILQNLFMLLILQAVAPYWLLLLL